MNSKITTDEKKRLEILKSYKILDTNPEEDYDNITFLASKICNTPISAITLIDEGRQWVKSKVGFEDYDSSLNTSFCSLAVSKPSELVVVPNISDDKEFNDISNLSGFGVGGFYASITLRDPEGYALGALCVVDSIPRELTVDQLKSLEILGNQVCKLLELRKRNINLAESNRFWSLKYSELERFARVVSHDIKSPLNNIISLVLLLKENCPEKFDESENEYLNYLTVSSYQLKDYVDGLLNYYKSDAVTVMEKEEIVLSDLLHKIIRILDSKGEYTFKIPDESVIIKSNQQAIEQILLNLISNGIKYNEKSTVIIEITCEESENQTVISVKDNGNGIDNENLESIFSFFTTLSKKDRFGNFGTGVGLATVKKIVENLNGKILVNSVPNEGSEFIISFDK